MLRLSFAFVLSNGFEVLTRVIRLRNRVRAGDISLQTYVDADYARDAHDRKSMSGYFAKVGNAICAWGARKQSAVALSTCEAEYYAMSHGCSRDSLLRRVLMEAGIAIHSATPLRSDNQSAIAWATGERSPSSRAKHVDVRVHFIRDLVKEEIIDILYVPTEENDADMLTKPLARVALCKAMDRIGLRRPAEEEC